MQQTPQQLKLNWLSLLGVALPVCLGVFVQFLMAFIDNYFVAKLNGNAMSGVAFVGLIYVTLAMLGVGLGNATQIMVARRKGEGNYQGVGEVVSNALWMALILGACLFSILYFIVPITLPYFMQSAEVMAYMQEFISYRAFGFFAYSSTLVLTSFWAGIASTRVMIYSTLITAGVNVILDYALIFGHFGMPELGVKGAAMATAIAEATSLIFLLYYTFHYSDKTLAAQSAKDNSRTSSYEIKKYIFSLPYKYTGNLIKLGGPIAMQLLLSLGIWAIFYGFVETMGEKPLQSSFIVRNMYMLAYVSVGGFAMATKTYVSGLMAEKRLSEIIPTIKKLIVLNFLGVFVLCHGLWLYPEWIASNFTADPLVIEQTRNIMLVVFPATLIFSVTSILIAMVEGSGNTVAGFVIEMITVCAYALASYAFVFKYNWPIHLVWTSDYLYFILIGLLSVLYLANGKWKFKKI